MGFLVKRFSPQDSTPYFKVFAKGRVMRIFFSFFLGLLLCPLLSSGKVFRNAYVAFELPDSWKCEMEVTEWVCRSVDPKSTREAIIILTAKEVGPTDSFEIYRSHLNEQRVLTGKGAGSKSQVVYKAKDVKINGQNWIDGLQLGSEIPNYYTRYLATIKDRLAILVTLSAHRLHYTKYSQDFFKTIQSLRVIASKSLVAGGSLAGSGGAMGMGGSFGKASEMAAPPVELTRAKKKKKSNPLMLAFMGLGGLVLLIGVVYLLKNKR